jgi:hypothetical protein
MVLRDNILHDRLNNSKYTVSEPPNFSLMEGSRKSDLYVVDEGKGCTVSVEFDRDAGLAALKTNPALMSEITQGAILQEAFKIKPDARQLIGSVFFGLLFGFFFGLMF